jgi:hypothetical protein
MSKQRIKGTEETRQKQEEKKRISDKKENKGK